MSLLKIENLYVEINNTKILNDINFSVVSGDYINIIGPNGAGKTTLLKSISKLIKSFTGNILIKSKDINLLSHNELAKKISYVPQFSSIKSFTNLSVFEYILTGRFPYINKLQGYTKSDTDKVKQIILDLQLENFYNRQITTLSGGELQKVILGASLVQETDIILLDEAATYLDIKHQIEFQYYIQKLLDNGKTIISITHNINEIVQSKSKVLALKNGEQIYFGDAGRFFENKLFEKVYDVEFKKIKINELNKDYYVPFKIVQDG